MFKFQLVTLKETFYPTLKDLEGSELYLGKHYCESAKEELQGMPKLDGFLGPMYNGTDYEGNTVIRYESPSVYALFD